MQTLTSSDPDLPPGLPCYDIRIDSVEQAEPAARKILAQISPDAPVRHEIVQEIYEDDGRGNIRDFIFSRFSAGAAEFDVIHERASGWVVNFRFRSPVVRCEQKPAVPGPLRFVGETSSWYRLCADRPQAEALLRLFVSELDRNGMEGRKTDGDRSREESRLRRILEGRDPHLLLLKFRNEEYAKGKKAAFELFDREAAELPEFSEPLSRLRAALKPPPAGS